MKKIALGALVALILSACGGNGSPGGTTDPEPPLPPGGYVAPPHVASSTVERKCVLPRPAGTLNPFSGLPYNDTVGTAADEKKWIRAFVNETYLWYPEVVEVDPALFALGKTVSYKRASDNVLETVVLNSNYDVLDAYFNTKRTTRATASGKPVDKFHFTYPTPEWVQQTSGGASVGFGFQVTLVRSTPPREILVVYTDPGTPAAEQSLNRGAKFIAVNGTDVGGGDPAILNEAFFGPIEGKAYTFTVRDQGSAINRTFTMTPRDVVAVPVQNVRTLAAPNQAVGYIQFNDHIGTAELQLVAAVNQLKAANGGAGITDLVLDLRYNGGGYLDLAGQMAYMIAGPARTTGKVFEKLSFNDKNPFGLTEAEMKTPFHTTTLDFANTGAPATALPTLNLGRVFVITSPGTCSASEAIMNGLRGVGVTVIQVGGTTCGKPYGFIPEDNCNTTYFAVQFKGVNEAGYGDYSDGFVPGGNGNLNTLQGCVVADDFTHALGDSNEANIKAALQYRSNSTCGPLPAASATFARVFGPTLARSPLRENRIYRPRSR
jgi:carboxyl-terminal processing protease